MRKIFFFLTVLIFVVCLLAGVSLAEQIPGLGIENGNEFSIQRTSSPYQHNILILHIDDLRNPNPQLISMWGLIVYFPEPKIILQPLYPLNRENNSALGGQFSLTANKNVNPAFVRAVAQTTEIAWNNYLLLDNSALATLYTTVLRQIDVPEPDPSATIIQIEYQYYLQICEAFASQGKVVFTPIDWQSLIPDHMKSNLALDDVLVNWQKLTANGQPIRCDVFSE